MKIAVWKTGHEIADIVSTSIIQGLPQGTIIHTSRISKLDDYDIHIGYGILRGMGEVFRACEKAGKPWFNIDRGYWKPNHYDGYYRVSLRGTQQTFGLDNLEPDYERWDSLGIEIDQKPLPYYRGKVLVCPPTEYAGLFYKKSPEQWIVENVGNTPEYFLRRKGCERSIEDDLDRSQKIITFNSSVGWEALRQGISVISDPTHSIVGAYQKLVDKSIHDDSNERRKLFAIQASLQRSLTEIREGQLWPLLQTLLNL